MGQNHSLAGCTKYQSANGQTLALSASAVLKHSVQARPYMASVQICKVGYFTPEPSDWSA